MTTYAKAPGLREVLRRLVGKAAGVKINKVSVSATQAGGMVMSVDADAPTIAIVAKTLTDIGGKIHNITPGHIDVVWKMDQTEGVGA